MKIGLTPRYSASFNQSDIHAPVWRGVYLLLTIVAEPPVTFDSSSSLSSILTLFPRSMVSGLVFFFFAVSFSLIVIALS
jgi:hypothetical protein